MKKYIIGTLLVVFSLLYVSASTSFQSGASTSFQPGASTSLQPGDTVNLSGRDNYCYYLENAGEYTFTQDKDTVAKNVQIFIQGASDSIVAPVKINFNKLNIENVGNPILKIKNAVDVMVNISGKNILKVDSKTNPVIRCFIDSNISKCLRLTGDGVLILSADCGRNEDSSEAAVIGDDNDTLIISGSPTVVAQTACKNKGKIINPSINIANVVLNGGTLMPSFKRNSLKNLKLDSAIKCTAFTMTGGSIPLFATDFSVYKYGYGFETFSEAYPPDNKDPLCKDILTDYRYFSASPENIHITGGTLHGNRYCSGFTPNKAIPSACIKPIGTSSKPSPTVTADADGIAVIPPDYTLHYVTPNDEGTAVVFGIPAVATKNGMTAHCDFGFDSISVGTVDQPIRFTLAIKFPAGITEDRTYNIQITETATSANPKDCKSAVVFKGNVTFRFNPSDRCHTAIVPVEQNYLAPRDSSTRLFRATVAHAYSVNAFPPIAK